MNENPCANKDDHCGRTDTYLHQSWKAAVEGLCGVTPTGEEYARDGPIAGGWQAINEL
jgi:hypothetical protein